MLDMWCYLGRGLCGRRHGSELLAHNLLRKLDAFAVAP
jgi:hypothetical protein